MSASDAWARNNGLIAEDTQKRLAAAVVLVAGVGGVGGRCAEVLARLGVGELRLADPDTFSATNLNRQAGCTLTTLGRNKAVVIGELCQSINSDLTLVVEESGVTESTLHDLVRGVQVIVDGTDYTQPHLGAALAEAARAEGVPVVMAVEIGFGGWVTTFPADDEPRFERLLGLPTPSSPASGGKPPSVPLWRWIGRLPRYVNVEAVQRVQAGELDAPAVAPAVELTAALAGTAVLDLLEGRTPVLAPRIHHVDVRSGTTRKYRPRYWRFVLSALLAKHLPARA